MDADLLRTADRNLRRTFGTYDAGVLTAADIDGLTAFVNGCATTAKGKPVTLTNQSFEGTGHGGQITMPREIWLAAGEELLADPAFNPNAPARTSRVIYPDYRYTQTV